MTAVLEAHGFGKRYRRRTWALRDVDLTVPEGTITALVGPNGSGKSTLIRAWIGFERPTEGRLSTGGVDPRRDRAGAVARVGYVPQSPSLYRDLTIADHITLAGDAPRRLRRRHGRALRRAAVDPARRPRRRAVRAASRRRSGWRSRSATRAPILLLDEPLASLDPLARREFLHLMVEAVRAAGATALLSSHVITDIEQACDRLIVLGKGHTLLDLSIAEALAHHRVVEGTAAEARGRGADAFVGAFPAPAGEPLALVRTPVVVAGGTRRSAGRRRSRRSSSAISPPVGARGDRRGAAAEAAA